MKHRFLYIILSIFLLFSVFSCENLLNTVDDDLIITGSDSESDSGDGKGSVTININPISEAIGSLVDKDTADSRMYLLLSGDYVISVKDSEDQVIATSSGSANTSGSSSVTLGGIEFGTGYYLEAQFYNPSDTTHEEPVLEGTSESFDVGIADVTVSVTLFPTSAETLTAGDTVDVSIKSTVFSTTYGDQKWYRIVAEDEAATVEFTPDSTSAVYFTVFDEDGNNLLNSIGYFEYGTYSGASGTYSIETTIDESYYVCVILAAESSSTHSLSIGYTNGYPYNKDTYEPNDSIDYAYEINLGTTYTASFHKTSDYDYFKLTVTEGNKYTVDPDPYGEASTYIGCGFYSSANNYLSSSSADTDSDGYSEYSYVADYSGTCDIYLAGYAGEYAFSVTEVLPPTASFTMSSTTVMTGDEVTFDASGSTADGTIESYAWDFGDDNSGSGESTTHTYDTVGQYWVTLTVTDSDGLEDSMTQSITVNSADNNTPIADAGADQEIDTDTDGSIVYLNGSGSSDSDGTLSYKWSFYSLPDYCSADDSDISGADTVSASFDIDSVGGEPDSNGELMYVMMLTVTDDDNAQSTDFVTITATGSGSVIVIVE